MFRWYLVTHSRVIYTDDGAKKETVTFKLMRPTAAAAMFDAALMCGHMWDFESVQEVTE